MSEETRRAASYGSRGLSLRLAFLALVSGLAATLYGSGAFRILPARTPARTFPDDPVELTAELVRIPSFNTDLVPSSGGEKEIIVYATEWLRRRGLTVEIVGSLDTRPSLVAIARGSGGGAGGASATSGGGSGGDGAPGPAARGRSLLLNAHVDVVGAGGYEGDPLNPRREGGRLYGRGSYDMKSGAAVAMTVAARVAAAGLRGDVIVNLVADEETESLGTRESLAHPAVRGASGAIVLEPSELETVVAHRGFAWLEVRIGGRAAHGSLRDVGRDAIVKAGSFLRELGRLDDELARRRPHPLLGTASVHAGTISGGEGLSTYPERCTISVEYRTLPGETDDDVVRNVQACIDAAAASDPTWVGAELELGLTRAPFSSPADDPLVVSLQAAARDLLPAPSPVVGAQFWTDAALIRSAGIPALMFGPSGAGAHAVTEWVDEASVRAVADVVFEAARRFLS